MEREHSGILIKPVSMGIYNVMITVDAYANYGLVSVVFHIRVDTPQDIKEYTRMISVNATLITGDLKKIGNLFIDLNSIFYNLLICKGTSLVNPITIAWGSVESWLMNFIDEYQESCLD